MVEAAVQETKIFLEPSCKTTIFPTEWLLWSSGNFIWWSYWKGLQTDGDHQVWSFSTLATEVSDKVWLRDNRDEEDNNIFTAFTILGKDNIDL